MEYIIKIPQQHLLYILAMLENIAAPMRQTAPVYENLQQQRLAQDNANAIPVAGVFVDDDTSADEFVANPMHVQV